MLVDRYGPVYGGYVSPKNVSFEARALPRTTKIEEYSVFVIKKDIKDVLSGVAAAWFGEPGGGTQYKLPLGTKQKYWKKQNSICTIAAYQKKIHGKLVMVLWQP